MNSTRQKIKIVALVSALSFMPASAFPYLPLLANFFNAMRSAPSTPPLTFKQRMVQTKDSFVEKKNAVVKKISGYLMLLKGQTTEAQQRRVEFYHWLEAKGWWLLHPKKWMTWIVTGNMPVKNPESRIHDETYVQYYIVYKQLCAGYQLSSYEKDMAREQAMQKLLEYKTAKGLV